MHKHITWPAPPPNSNIMSSHPWRILLLIAVNRNTERLWSLKGLMACWLYLTLIAFFLHSKPLSYWRVHYYSTKKKFNLTNGFGYVLNTVWASSCWRAFGQKYVPADKKYVKSWIRTVSITKKQEALKCPATITMTWHRNFNANEVCLINEVTSSYFY